MVQYSIVLRPETCIAAINKLCVSEFLEHCFFQGLQGFLFVLVSREEGKCQGDSIRVCEHSHLHDRIGTVFLALPVFFASLFLLDLKVIVCTVIIEDPVFPVDLEITVFIGFCLYEVTFPGKHTQGPVDIMLLIGRFFEKLHCCLVGCTFAARIQDSGVDQV